MEEPEANKPMLSSSSPSIPTATIRYLSGMRILIDSEEQIPCLGIFHF